MDEPTDRLSHLDPRGRPRMVDVSGKEESRRTAMAEGYIRMRKETSGRRLSRN
jgi:cyclic pyranopterin phosphate synthase